MLAFCGDRDLAQEGTQEAFTRAYSRWRRLRKDESVVGWIITTAINHTKRSFRRRKGDMELPAPDSDPSGDRLDVARALLALPTRQRQAVVLFHIADQPIGAVAELMGISEGPVKSHLDRARKSLRSALEVKHV
ncbi:MAG: RNA polymerase sigma factor [Actinomycetota bacterium]